MFFAIRWDHGHSEHDWKNYKDVGFRMLYILLIKPSKIFPLPRAREEGGHHSKVVFSVTAALNEATGLQVTPSSWEPFSVTEPLSRQNAVLHQAECSRDPRSLLCVGRVCLRDVVFPPYTEAQLS